MNGAPLLLGLTVGPGEGSLIQFRHLQSGQVLLLSSKNIRFALLHTCRQSLQQRVKQQRSAACRHLGSRAGTAHCSLLLYRHLLYLAWRQVALQNPWFTWYANLQLVRVHHGRPSRAT